MVDLTSLIINDDNDKNNEIEDMNKRFLFASNSISDLSYNLINKEIIEGYLRFAGKLWFDLNIIPAMIILDRYYHSDSSEIESSFNYMTVFMFYDISQKRYIYYNPIDLKTSDDIYVIKDIFDMYISIDGLPDLGYTFVHNMQSLPSIFRNLIGDDYIFYRINPLTVKHWSHGYRRFISYDFKNRAKIAPIGSQEKSEYQDHIVKSFDARNCVLDACILSCLHPDELLNGDKPQLVCL